MKSPLKHEYVQANGISLHVVQAGPVEGPPLLFLHGFPEFWYGWRRQIDFFAQSGYRVIIPDQRGYNLSEKPKTVAAYHINDLAKDVIGLIDAFELKKVVLAGHDWGGAVAWRIAARHPRRLEKLIILNAPHPGVLFRTLQRSWKQRRKSWYMLFFRIPQLPEWIIRRQNWRAGINALQNSSRPGTFSKTDLQKYREAWAQPGAFRAMINWYRAALRHKAKSAGSARITAPTLVIWGTEDKFLGREMAEPSINKCDNGRLVFIEGATHWVQHEEPEQVNLLMRQFIEE